MFQNERGPEQQTRGAFTDAAALMFEEHFFFAANVKHVVVPLR